MRWRIQDSTDAGIHASGSSTIICRSNHPSLYLNTFFPLSPGPDLANSPQHLVVDLQNY